MNSKNCFSKLLITICILLSSFCQISYAGNVFQGDVQYNVYGPKCVAVVRHDELRGESEWLKNIVYNGIRACAQDFANYASQGKLNDPYALGETRVDALIINTNNYVSVKIQAYPPSADYYLTYSKNDGQQLSLSNFLPPDVMTRECFEYGIRQGWIEKYNFDPYYRSNILDRSTEDFYINPQLVVVFTDRSQRNQHFLGSLIFKITNQDYIKRVREWLNIGKYQNGSAQSGANQKVYVGVNGTFTEMPTTEVLSKYQGKWQSPDGRLSFEIQGDTVRDQGKAAFLKVQLSGKGTVNYGEGYLQFVNPPSGYSYYIDNMFRLYWNNGILEAEYYDGRGAHTTIKRQLIKVE